MDTRRRAKLKRIKRKIWLLWAPALMLIALFAGTAYFLHLNLTHLVRETNTRGFWLYDGYYLGVGLAGIVLLFVLYTIWKQIELHTLREKLLEEEAEQEALRTRFEELVGLFQIASTRSVRVSAQNLLEIVVRRAVDSLKAQQASVMLLDDQNHALQTVASYGVGGEFAEGRRQSASEGVAGWVARNKRALLLPRDASSLDAEAHLRPHRHITSSISVPILVEKRCVGVLNINRINHPEPFSEEQLEILTLFGGHVGALVERARAVEDLEHRAEVLERDNLRLAEFNQIKDVFLSTASHELKTPLTSVIAYAELLNENENRLQPSERAEFLGRLQSEANRLLGLIENILDLSRLETGKTELELKPLPASELVHSSVETATPLADKADVTIHEVPAHEEEILLSVDEVKMRQVILNLLTNAIRFSPEGGTVTVRTRREDGNVVISVSDQGVGIDAGDLEHIFTLFGQGLRKSNTNTPGLGIGLHLVKRIVEMHNGRVEVQSSPGEGSTFLVRLPTVLASGATARAA
jgi:signal transduction histidine kinase